MTRDRVAYDAQWTGRAVHRGRHRRLGARRQRPRRGHRRPGRDRRARPPTSSCSWSTPRSAPTDEDEAAVRMLRRTNKPVILVANKVDNAAQELESAALWSLGPRPAVPGLGAARPRLRRPARRDAGRAARRRRRSLESRPRGPRRVALVGRPNVGKSSLLNRLADEERAVVDSVAGTTVDPVDSLVEIGGETWQFVDTAGLRRKGRHGAAAPSTTRRLRTAGGDRGGRGRRRAARRQRADQRAGPAGADDGHRGRPGAGASPSTSGTWSTRTAAYYLDKEIERELRAHPVGASGSTSRPRPAGRSTSSPRRCTRPWPAGSSGCRPASSTSASPRSCRRRRTRCAAGGRRGCCSRPRPAPAAAVRAVHHRRRSTPATSGSSSASCARSSASRAPRSRSASSPARRTALVGRNSPHRRRDTRRLRAPAR